MIKLLYIAILLFTTGIYFEALSEEIAVDHNIEFFADDESDIDIMFSSKENNIDDDVSIIDINNIDGLGINQNNIKSAEDSVDIDSKNTTENILVKEGSIDDSDFVEKVEIPPFLELDTNLGDTIQTEENKETNVIVSNSKNDVDNDDLTRLMVWKGSFLYTQKEITILKETVDRYRMIVAQEYKGAVSQNVADNVDDIINKPTDAFISLVRIAQLSEADRPAPVFYLDSILYFSEENWSIWLNGKKFSLENKNIDNFEILEVKPEVIQVSYKVDSTFLRNYFPAWKKVLTKKSNDSKILASVDNKINYNTESNIMIFNLQPNQSIKIAKLEILEGKHHVGHDFSNCGFSSCKVDIGEIKEKNTRVSKKRHGIEKVKEQNYNPLQSLKNLIK